MTLRCSFAFLWLTAFAAAGCSSASKRAIDHDLYLPVTFIEHKGPAEMQNYLAVNIHHPSVEAVRRDLEITQKLELKSRGESHITVITPLEYEQILSKYVSIDAINEVARNERIQQIPFEVHCVGMGQKDLDGKNQRTYFIVVKSPGLLHLRERIKDVFVHAGGDPQTFLADVFYPHITVGFTERDLHLDDGVIKNESSCLYGLQAQKPE